MHLALNIRSHLLMAHYRIVKTVQLSLQKCKVKNNHQWVSEYSIHSAADERMRQMQCSPVYISLFKSLLPILQ